jgi:hypothetical protein
MDRPAASIFVVVLLLAGAASGWSQCVPSVPQADFVYRFGLADGIRSDADLLVLLENPMVITSQARATEPGDPAATIATTDTHVLYPIEAQSIVATLNDAESLTGFIPDLAIHETLCRNGPDMVKQFQRTEFNVLFFTFGTEYLIDVHFALNGPQEYGTYWGMYESVDGKLAYQYGSWYFKNVVIDGRQYAYVRHFTTSGVNSRIPGLRIIIERSAGDRIIEMLDAIYREAASRYGTSPIASAP